MHHFVDELRSIGHPSLGVFHERAKGLYDENMASYVKLILRRSFGRLMVSLVPSHSIAHFRVIFSDETQDFFDGIEKQLRTTPANEVSLHGSYSKSTLKKVLKDFSAKDMRKAVETISKRVDKHLIDDTDAAAASDPALAALVLAVWREVSGGLKSEITRDEGLIKACYADSGVSMDFGPGDVDAACKKARQ